MIVGEVIRKSSMFTAKTNFNHYVQYVKQRGHQLVTTGIYSLCRHPSYMGWFLWSIGTQVRPDFFLLINLWDFSFRLRVNGGGGGGGGGVGGREKKKEKRL